MLNTILAIVTFFTLTGTENTNDVQANVTESTVIWKATKVVGGGHEGTVVVKEADLKLKGTELKGGSFTVDMTTISSTDLEGEWKDKLDGHLKNDDFFGVATYPTSTFKITKVQKTAEGKYNVTGDITIKGTTESITFPTTVTAEGDKVTTNATITLNRTKYGVKYGSSSFFDNLGDKAISDEFKLIVTLVTVK
ncbi:YceI family protein [Reichenbachiella agariperforans]|uniref:YceI-like domain-containing protein n=1 Tax=Reichenbachiella agariperforans TaxID=156994 RepID=A0A1M6TPU7_REIAG|nr:YceI family protein [Reichenbachiella agariperforans]MBU2915524.1 YceI family protein [Reichenbachiella agariperforans]SHK58964.1 YceI-like domain-containing protein [Reichenbachiella agariperforans]